MFFLMKKHYTLIWNKKAGCFIANVRKPNGSGWMKKWIPKGLFLEHQNLEAESWLMSWFSDYTRTTIAPNNAQVITKKTLAVYLPKWLELRRKAVGTGLNTWYGYKRSVNCYLLDNPKHQHLSIDRLDITSELCQVTVLREWIQSLPGAIASRLQVIAALSIFFNDAVGEGWLDEDFVNPMQKRAIASLIREMKELRRKTAEVKVIAWEHVVQLVTGDHRQNSFLRRVRYLLAVSTGLRDNEIQGLIWSDLHLDAEIPFIDVTRQLVKRGAKPWKVYEKELAKGRDKLEILAGDNAVVSEPKTHASVGTVPLHPSTVAALKELYRSTSWQEQDDPVFSLDGTFYQTRSVVLRGDMKRLKLCADEVTFHAMRRTFASKLAACGVDDGTIERLLRHSKKSTARVHYIQDDLTPLYAAVCKLPIPLLSPTKTVVGASQRSSTYEISAESAVLTH